MYSLAEQFHYPEQEINNIIVASMNGTKIGLEVGNVDEIIDVPDEKVISMPVIMKAVENCFDEVASYAKEHFEKSVKKTLTIPAWLNTAALEKNVNFSKILQEALKKELHLG